MEIMKNATSRGVLATTLSISIVSRTYSLNTHLCVNIYKLTLPRVKTLVENETGLSALQRALGVSEVRSLIIAHMETCRIGSCVYRGVSCSRVPQRCL